MPHFLRRKGLLPPVWMFVQLGALACTSGEHDSPAPASLNPAQYGEEVIGYKQAKSSAESSQNADGAPISGAAISDDGQYGSADYEGDDEYAESSSAAPPAPPSMEPIEPAPPATALVPTVAPTSPALPPDAGPLSDAGPSAVGVDAGRDGGVLISEAGSSSVGPNATGDAAIETTTADGGSPDGGPLDGGAVSIRLSIPDFSQIPETERVQENPFRTTEEMAASTFSIDVDTASYSMARAAVNAGRLPERSSVRVEEFINYFHLHYAQPSGAEPFSVYTELGSCPWNMENQLLLIGLQGQEVPLEQQPPANLVFLIDTSGSMAEPNKLPLLKQGFRMMARQLRPNDKISMVTYAGSDRVVLDAVNGSEQEVIQAAIANLEASGSTNGEGGIQRAYEIAEGNFIDRGNKSLMLATDGDFNVGISDPTALADFIASKRPSGVMLSVYGFGNPGENYNDAVSESLADNGNGIYFFIDSPEEARRAFIHTLTGSLLTVAKDVKLQLQFNPEQVRGYRLIGYENRVLANTDFNNDSVDAGELGAGLSVTALVEIIPAGSSTRIPVPAEGTDPLPAASSAEANDPQAVNPEDSSPVTGPALLDVRIRFKGADAEASQLRTSRINAKDISPGVPSLKFSFASGVAELAMQLRGSQYLPRYRGEELSAQLQRALPADAEGAVKEFISLAESAHAL